MEKKRDLIAAISRLYRMMRRHPREDDQMTYTGNHILHLAMDNDGIRTTELAELAGMRPASITDALNRLEKNGFVSREKDAADSRAKRVFITEKTRQEIAIRTRFKRERNEQMLSCLTDEEAETFLSIYGKLCAFLESDNGGNHGKE